MKRPTDLLPPRHAATGHGLRILVIDASDLVADRLGRALGAIPGVGCVQRAGEAAHAIAMVRRSPPDLVILDINLGESRGLDVLDYLREQQPRIKLIVIADDDTVTARIHLLATGVYAYFDKSLEFDDLQDLVAQLAS